MLNQTIGRPAPTRWGDLATLPYLTEHHTIEELQAWRAEVAKLKTTIVPPSLDSFPGEVTDQQVKLHNNANKVVMEQRMQAQAADDAKDPDKTAQRARLARIELAHLDATIGRLQARRAEVAARVKLKGKS